MNHSRCSLFIITFQRKKLARTGKLACLSSNWNYFVFCTYLEMAVRENGRCALQGSLPGKYNVKFVGKQGDIRGDTVWPVRPSGVGWLW